MAIASACALPRSRPGPAPQLSLGWWTVLAYVAVFVAIAMQYLTPLDLAANLDTNIRWAAFMAVTIPAILLSLRGASRAVGCTLGVLLLANSGLRLLSTGWSGLPLYTLYRGISISLLALFLLLGLRARLRTGADYERLLAVLAAVAALLFVPGVVVGLAGLRVVPWSGMPVYRGYSDRFCGILGNPNHVGICAAVLLPIVVAMSLRSRRRWPYVLIALAIVGSVVASRSRAGMLGSIISVLATTGIWLGWRRSLVAGMAISFVAAVLLLAHEKPAREAAEFYLRVNTAGKNVQQILEDAGKNRLERWALTVASAKKRLLLGQGYGVSGHGRTLPGGYDFGYPPHNSYLSVLQENGLLGLLALAPLLIGTLRRTIKGHGTVASSRVAFLYAAFGGAVVGGLINAAFESWLLSVGFLATMPFWTCVVALWSLDAPRRPLAGRRVRLASPMPSLQAAAGRHAARNPLAT